MMINVKINSHLYLLPEKCSLSEALAFYNLQVQNFAVAIDGKLVPRSQYAQLKLRNDNCIDIIVPMQGG
ncbi:MAG: sulfur carrier protein ThiS [Gammaproteobacteria bacterium]|nr:sulfur carrier protein ThiS [Gammaproteobacteria bacterium]